MSAETRKTERFLRFYQIFRLFAIEKLEIDITLRRNRLFFYPFQPDDEDDRNLHI